MKHVCQYLKQCICLLLLLLISPTLALAKEVVRVGVAGISHGHSSWIFNPEMNKGEIAVVGIYETDQELVQLFQKRYQLPASLFYTDLEKMLKEVKPEGVMAFGAINEHIKVVRACAPQKIHVMVEKPLATTYEDAIEIEQLAKKHSIEVLTNFETSWYASNQFVRHLLDEGKLGTLRRVIVNDGHGGPPLNDKFFMGWLADPIKNGGGALTDFGCYGANLMTWLLKGQRPLSVTAVTNQNRPDLYPKVDDDATIIVQYPEAQCVIQASWGWSYSRKDMEVYGTKGYGIAVDRLNVRHRVGDSRTETHETIAARPVPFEDPFAVFARVIRGTLKLEPFDQYGLPINVIAVEILDAARRSARTGQTVELKQ